MIRVLVVEDSAPIARAHERLVRLELGPCDVAVLATAEEAIARLTVEHFDLVISDFDLAGRGTGADVLAAVRRDLDRPRFLFVSGNEAIGTFGVPFLDKPCLPRELRGAITAAIGCAA